MYYEYQIATVPSLKKVETAMLSSEPFYGVRIEVAKALAKSATAASIRILSKMLLNESTPQGQAGIALHCVGMLSPSIPASLFQRGSIFSSIDCITFSLC